MYRSAHAEAPSRRTVYVLLAITAACAVGCQSTSTATKSTQPAPSGSTGAPVGATYTGPALPIEAYLIKNSERDEVTAARQILIKQCMDGFGFDYRVPRAQPDRNPSGDSANMARHYGLTDTATASAFGYHLPGTGPTGLGTPDPSTDPSMSAAEQAVMLGRENAATSVTLTDSPVLKTFAGKAVPAGGCTGDADRRLGGELDERLAEQIDIQGFRQSSSDPRVVAVLQKWSVCMQRNGYTAKTLADVPGPLGNSPGPTPAEIQMARTDVTCKQQANLVPVWFAVESQIEKNLIEQNQLALTEARTVTENSLAAAAKIAGR